DSMKLIRSPMVVFSVLGSLLLLTAGAPTVDDDFFKEKKDQKPPFLKKKSATDELIHFSVKVDPPEAKRGQTVKVIITGTPAPEHWAYPLTQRAAGQNAAYLLKDLIFEDVPGLKPLWPITESDPQEVFEPTEMAVFLKHKEPFTWSRDVLILSDAKPGTKTITIKTKGLQVCNEQRCVPGDQEMQAEFTVSDAPAVPLTPEL